MPVNNTAQMDVISAGKDGLTAMGGVAAKLLSGNFSVNALRTQDVLRKDEWKMYDTKVIEIARQRLVATGDLIGRGLSLSIPNALGVTKVEWETMSELGDAIISMHGLTQGQNDRVEYTLNSMPLPIVHKDFHINVRALEASRTTGMPLDTTQAELAARIVSEKIESLIFLGSSVAGTGNSIAGLTTESNRNTGSVTTAAWSTQAASTTTAYTIITDVLAMIDKAIADNMFGPYMLYVPTGTYVALGNDFKANGDKTILQRIKDIPGILDVRPTNNLTGANVVLVQMTADVIDMVDGIQPTVVMWESHGGMLLNFKVLAIMVPRVRSTRSGQSGVVHYS